MTQSWQVIAARAVSVGLGFCAVALVLFVTLIPVRAETIRVAEIMPLDVPRDLVAVRAQPALGPTIVPLAPGEQPLTATLLSNYIERQKALRSFDVLGAEAPRELNAEVLMSYISRGSIGGGNGALSAIASYTGGSSPTPQPDLNPAVLARYVDDGFLPTAKRMEQANNERGCLAQAIYHEARGESEAGQMAVANVIVNRARSGKFPSTLCGVIYQNANKGRYRCQFTFACDGRDDTPGERSAWARSTGLAKSVYAEFALGEAVGAVPGSALYYHTTNVSPSWSNTYNQVAQIGSHIFYSPN